VCTREASWKQIQAFRPPLDFELYVIKTLELGGTVDSYVNKFDNKYIGSQHIWDIVEFYEEYDVGESRPRMG